VKANTGCPLIVVTWPCVKYATRRVVVHWQL